MDDYTPEEQKSPGKICESDVNDFLSICEEKKKSDGQRILQFSILVLFVAILFVSLWRILNMESAQGKGNWYIRKSNYNKAYKSYKSINVYAHN